MRFHSLTDNTSRYFVAANNFPYGAPPKMEDNEMDYGEPTWDKVPEEFIILGDNVSVGLSDQVFMAEDVAKCFSCGGWYPLESCVLNYDETHKAVPVCESCADGKV
tara:strand:- start:136 stop:453 length:318 start_codon:yes stop_codon:yes gene_type:complete